MKSEFGRNQVQVDELLERLEKVDQGEALFLAGIGGDETARSPGSDRDARRGEARRSRT